MSYNYRLLYFCGSKYKGQSRIDVGVCVIPNILKASDFQYIDQVIPTIASVESVIIFLGAFEMSDIEVVLGRRVLFHSLEEIRYGETEYSSRD